MSTTTETPINNSAATHHFDLIAVGGASVDNFLNLIENDPKWRLDLKTKEICFEYGEKITVESSEVLMGGNAQNVAIGVSRLGYKVALMAEVGDDFYAEEIGRNLLKENVDTRLMLQTTGVDTSASVVLNIKGDRTLFSQHASHEHNFHIPPGIATRLIYLTSLGGVWEHAYTLVLDFAAANQVPIAFNPGTRQITEKGDVFWRAIKQAHILLVNLEEAQKILKGAKPKVEVEKLSVQELMTEISKLGPKIVVITDGKNGSFARAEDGRCFEQGLVPANVVERTGAGDSFSAGVVGAALAGMSLQKSMYWGAKNAASVVGRVGAQPGLLNRKQIEAEGDPLMVDLGVDAPLIILPFDHRTSLAEYCFKKPVDELTPEQSAHLKDDKMVVYEGVKEAISLGLPQTEVAISIEEQFGHKVIDLANRENMAVILPVEKSGKSGFEFAYGDQFAKHIEKFKPSFTKAMVYYNPRSPLEERKSIQAKLKQLADYSHQHGYKFLLEIVIKPTEKQLEKANGEIEVFNETIKPELRLKSVFELQDAAVEPDVWQMDHFSEPEEYRKLVAAVRRDGRDNVGVIISDHDASSAMMREAISASAAIPGVIGFAAGSPVFWTPISDYHRRIATRQQARNRVAQEFMGLYQHYKKVKSSAESKDSNVASHTTSQPIEAAPATPKASQPAPAGENVGSMGGRLAQEAAAEAEKKAGESQAAAQHERAVTELDKPKRGLLSRLFKR